MAIVYGLCCVLLSDFNKEACLGIIELHCFLDLPYSHLCFCSSDFFSVMDELKIHNQLLLTSLFCTTFVIIINDEKLHTDRSQSCLSGFLVGKKSYGLTD